MFVIPTFVRDTNNLSNDQHYDSWLSMVRHFDALHSRRMDADHSKKALSNAALSIETNTCGPRGDAA